MEKRDKESLARKRASVILRVRAGQMTVTEGAKELGISRKSYYAWERRALRALMEEVTERPSGRPQQEEPGPEEKEKEEKIRTLEQENEILRARVEIQQLMMEMQLENKKKQKQKKRKRS